MPASASLLAISGAVRVASLDLCADEYLLMLARPAEIASVSRLSHDPADSPLWRSARRFPANRGELESVLRHRPTLLLTSGGGGRGTATLARRMGVRLVALPYPVRVRDVAANIARVAGLLGDPRRAEAWQARLARLRPVARPRGALFLSGNGASLPPASLGAEWMRLAGFAQQPVAEGRVTLERLLLRPPAVLLRSDYRRGQASLGQRWLDHPAVRRVAQVATDGRPWTCAGPLMLGEVERLRGRR